MFEIINFCTLRIRGDKAVNTGGEISDSEDCQNNHNGEKGAFLRFSDGIRGGRRGERSGWR